MSRKRSRPLSVKNIVKEKHKKEQKRTKLNKKAIIAISLVGIFCLVLFFNSYFNYTSGTAFNEEGTTIGTRFFLSGPDPYYNMRLCQQTLETGQYPFVTEGDPLLNYPVSHGTSARPPLFNMITVGLTKVFENFMPTLDALGWLMLFLPALYGALLVFPIYGIGKELFNKKVGLISALFIAIIPIHLGGGHGSAFSLYDHDSFLLLLFAITFYLFIKALKSSDKRGLFYASLAGISAAAIQLTWAAGQVVLLIIFIYALVQFLFDVLQSKQNILNASKTTIVLGVSYFISLPFFIAKNVPFHYAFYLFVFSLILLVFYVAVKKINVPWIISIPMLAFGTGAGLTLLYLVNKGIIVLQGAIYSMSEIIFGEGVYGSKVALTIGEAHVYNLSRTVMSFGPVIYWLALVGFIFYIAKSYKEKFHPESLFFLIVFLINFWFTTTAGRFANDLIPCIAVFGAYITWIIIDKFDYKTLMKNLRSVVGFRKVRLIFKPRYVIGMMFLIMLIVPNTYMALDAAVPPEKKADIFGSDFRGAYGNSLGQQIYWADALNWLSLQDTEIEDPAERPAIITWWDYGFYIASMSEHPAVADNYQSGIPCAGNFHTAKSEEEAVAVLIVRLVEGQKERMYEKTGISQLPENVEELFDEYLGNESTNLTNILNNPKEYAPTYNDLIASEYGNTVLRKSAENAMYHDSCKIIIENLNDEQITELYKYMRELTGNDIIYYGIDQRDLEIFAVFPFLSDKSTHGYVTTEDDYFITNYVDTNTGIEYTFEQLNELTREEYEALSLSQQTKRKEAFFNNMYFRTYYGLPINNNIPEDRLPTYGLRHWKIAYVSPYVTITRYYEGAKITGTVDVNGMPYAGTAVVVIDEYGIAHDIFPVGYNGQFNVIAPEGNITLSLFIGDKFLDTKKLDSPITEEEATREIDTLRFDSFSINLSSINISVTGLNQTATLNITSLIYPEMQQSVNMSEEGDYQFNNLIPSDYEVTLRNETTIFYKEILFFKPNANQFEIVI